MGTRRRAGVKDSGRPNWAREVCDPGEMIWKAQKVSSILYVLLTEAGVFGQAQPVYEQAYQDMFIFKRRHVRNTQDYTLLMRSEKFQYLARTQGRK